MNFLARLVPASRRGRIVLTVVLALAVAPLAAVTSGAYEGSSFYDNVAPKSQLQGKALIDKYPMFNYSLDSHVGDVVTTADVGHVPGSGGLVGPKDKPGLIDWILGNTISQVPTGVDPAAMFAGIVFLLTSIIWYLTLFWTFVANTIFAWAFSLDLLNGASGALAPVARAVQNLYSDLGSWLPVSITFLGAWAMWGIVRGRHGSTFAQLGMTIVCFIVALWIITQPLTTIGGASKWANDASVGVLASLNGNGASGDPKTTASDRLTHDNIQNAWLVLNFGGLEHCVDAANKPVKPKSPECHKSGMVDHRRYLDRWLSAGVANSDARNLEYQALRDGKAPPASAINDAGLPADAFAGYNVTAADKASVDAQQKEGALQRLGFAFFIAGGNMGSNILILALAIGMILAQVLALLLFGFAAVALLLVVAWPGGGQGVFLGWLAKLAFVITRKIWYSLILAIVLTITAAVSSASDELGWGLAYGLQAAFYWMVLIFRKEIYATLLRALPGGQHGEHRENRLGGKAIRTYYGFKVARAVGKSIMPGGGGRGGRPSAKPTQETPTYTEDGRATPHDTAPVQLTDEAASSRTGVVGAAVGTLGGQVAAGHTGAMVAAGTTGAAAIAELQGEHAGNVQRLRREESRRAEASTLRQRDAAASAQAPGALERDKPKPLTERERAHLTHLDANRMDDASYRGLQGTVREVEQRVRDSGGVAFTEDAVREREQQIRAREGGSNDTAAGAARTQTERDVERARRHAATTTPPSRNEPPTAPPPKPPTSPLRPKPPEKD
jgi:hypothetical protein